MKRALWTVFVTGIIALTVAGCSGSKDPTSLGRKNDALFQSGDAQVKACWESAMAALKTNGYAAAILSLQEITKGTNSTAATPEQVNAVNETVTAVSDKMYDAANRGDANAQASLDELRRVMGR